MDIFWFGQMPRRWSFASERTPRKLHPILRYTTMLILVDVGVTSATASLVRVDLLILH